MAVHREETPEAWTCMAPAWERCACSAGLGATSPGSQRTLSWGRRGKPVQKNYYPFVCCHVLVKEGSSREGKGDHGKMHLSVYCGDIECWTTQVIYVQSLSVLDSTYSAVPVSNDGIHLSRHQHLRLSCSFPIVGKRHFLQEMSKEDQRTAL